MTKEKTRISDAPHTQDTSLRDLVVHNDNVNTFDYVIETLMEVCKHDEVQAEQCTMLIHYRGRCAVRSGDHATLKPMYQEINNRGISATIE